MKESGIEVVWVFPGQANMVRFFKQRCSGYGEVPEVIRELTRFKDLWEDRYSVFDQLSLDDIKLNFAAPVQNQDGMQVNHNVKFDSGPLSKYNRNDVNKFNAQFQ